MSIIIQIKYVSSINLCLYVMATSLNFIFISVSNISKYEIPKIQNEKHTGANADKGLLKVKRNIFEKNEENNDVQKDTDLK